MTSPNLSIHFKIDEFRCPCCGKADMHMILIQSLEILRSNFCSPVIITEGGGYRCSKYNSRIRSCDECKTDYHGVRCPVCNGYGEQRSARWSRHMMGTEADIKVCGVSQDDVALFCENDKTMAKLIKNIGRYNTFTHVGIGGNRAHRWDNRTRRI